MGSRHRLEDSVKHHSERLLVCLPGKKQYIDFFFFFPSLRLSSDFFLFLIFLLKSAEQPTLVSEFMRAKVDFSSALMWRDGPVAATAMAFHFLWKYVTVRLTDCKFHPGTCFQGEFFFSAAAAPTSLTVFFFLFVVPLINSCRTS